MSRHMPTWDFEETDSSPLVWHKDDERLTADEKLYAYPHRTPSHGAAARRDSGYHSPSFLATVDPDLTLPNDFECNQLSA
jgi:hypothetical protein